MAIVQRSEPSRRPAGQKQWFEKSSSAWTNDDREKARRYSADRWTDIRGDLPDPVATRPEVDVAREHVVTTWVYNGNSREAFLAHCTLHLRTLMYVLLRDREGLMDTAPCEDARRRLSQWLNEDPLPHERLVVAAACKDRESGRGGGPTYVWRFCEETLGSVIAGYTPGKASPWGYLKSSFEHYVSRNPPGGPGDRLQPPEPPVSSSPGSGQSVSPPDKEPVTIPGGDDKGGKSDQSTSRLEKEPAIELRDDDKEEECAEGEDDADHRRGRELKRVLRELKEREKQKGNHGGMILRTCGGCRQLLALALHRHEVQRRQRRALETADGGEESDALSHKHDGALCALVAERTKLSPNLVKQLIYRMRHRLRAELQRHPRRLEFDSVRNRWRVQLNRFAMWDTPVRLSCSPTDLARLPRPAILVSKCEDWSEPFEVMLSDLPISRPTGLTFAGHSGPKATVLGSLRMNQVRLRAAANGRRVDAWVQRKARKELDLAVTFTGSPQTALLLDGRRQALPATVHVQRRSNEVPISLDLSASKPVLAGIECDPSIVIGGDDACVFITIGARLVAEGNGHRVETSLPMTSKTPIRGDLLSTDPSWEPIGWYGKGPVVKKVAKTQPVAIEARATLSATSGDTRFLDTLTLLPPEIVSLKLLDERRRQTDTVRAGRTIDVEVELSHSAACATEVALSVNHSAARVETEISGKWVPARSAVVLASKSSAQARISVADNAQDMWARVEASANGTTKSARLHVEAKTLRLSFESSLTAGSATTGKLICEPPVLQDTTFALRMEGEETGGLIRSSTATPSPPLVEFPREITIQKGEREARFEVTSAVAARRRVTIIATGLEGETHGSFSLNSPPREWEGAPDGA